MIKISVIRFSFICTLLALVCGCSTSNVVSRGGIQKRKYTKGYYLSFNKRVKTSYQHSEQITDRDSLMSLSKVKNISPSKKNYEKNPIQLVDSLNLSSVSQSEKSSLNNIKDIKKNATILNINSAVPKEIHLKKTNLHEAPSDGPRLIEQPGEWKKFFILFGVFFTLAVLAGLLLPFTAYAQTLLLGLIIFIFAVLAIIFGIRTIGNFLKNRTEEYKQFKKEKNSKRRIKHPFLIGLSFLLLGIILINKVYYVIILGGSPFFPILFLALLATSLFFFILSLIRLF